METPDVIPPLIQHVCDSLEEVDAVYTSWARILTSWEAAWDWTLEEYRDETGCCWPISFVVEYL